MNYQPPKRGDSATRHQHNSHKHSIAELKAAMEGRWLQAVYDASGIPKKHLNGRGHACPKCGGKDRFAAFPDFAERGSVHCRMCFDASTDPRPGDGIATLRWLLDCDLATACQWLIEWLGWDDSDESNEPDDGDEPPREISRVIPLKSTAQRKKAFGKMTKSCCNAMLPAWWDRLAERLELPAKELKRLHVGWSHEHNATTWPMRNYRNRIIGVRLRSMVTGEKWCVKGSVAGLFLPRNLSSSVNTLFIAEGPTDCAALLSLGFDCIGRPSCNGAVRNTLRLVRRLRPKECVVVADDDANEAGKKGAEALAAKLARVCPRVRIIYPPAGHNDARDWVRSGATADDLLQVVHASVAKSLTIKHEVTK